MKFLTYIPVCLCIPVCPGPVNRPVKQQMTSDVDDADVDVIQLIVADVEVR